MDSFYFEEKIQEYKEIIGNYNFNITSFKLLLKFYEELFMVKDKSLIEIYLIETSSYFASQLKKYSCFGFSPNFSHIIISIVDKVLQNLRRDDQVQEIQAQLNRIKEEKKKLDLILEGKSEQDINDFSVGFLVIEKSTKEQKPSGLVESLSISINKNKKTSKNEFIIFPSLPKIEENLQRQINESWKFATNYLKSKYSKKIPKFEVTIKFVNNLGIYEGDSLGVALTIGFIEELFSFFDLRERLIFSNAIITTGSVDAEGKVNEVSKSIIEIKSYTAFYSNANKFILPIEDYPFALKICEEELKKYPNRNLELIPIKNIKDAINRRDLLVIKRQNILKWGVGKIIKNKAILVLLILFSIIALSFYYITQDKNPSKLELVDGRFLIKNKQDKVLWYKETGLGNNYRTNKIALWNKYRFIDVDNDGLNEVLMVHLKNSQDLYLFDDDGKMIWSFKHSDTLLTNNEKFTDIFIPYGIIDTIKTSTRIELLIYFQHNTYYPTGITKLDLLTGLKISDILWHPGSITGAILTDWNKDGKKEIIAGGPANGMNRSYLFSIDHDKLCGTFPTSENYKFLNMKIAEMNKYLLFPKTDYAELFFPKYNAPKEAPTIINENIISINIGEGCATAVDADFVYAVRLNRNLNPINCVIGDASIIIRDRLVNDGKLNPPLSDSREFQDSILKNIQYWDGQKFVKY